MNMKVKLNISHGLHSHQISIFYRTTLEESEIVFLQQEDLATVLKAEWLKIPLDTVKGLVSFISNTN